MEEINEWQQIEQQTTLESSGWNRVIINQNNIELQGENDQSSSSSSSASNYLEEHGISSSMTAASSISDEEGATPMPVVASLDWASEVKKLLKVRFEAIRVEIVKVASKVRNCAMCAGVFWSITYVAGAAAATMVLVSLVYVGIQRRRRKVDHLHYLLRQKDEKISQLLLHIAHLNEALSSSRGRTVRVYRIGG
ncbi:hypothetical protein L195_g029822 [Trifolium pratense]|uniref:Transmembrane protein n=1 Tax=Trifolium pratense TaxID=57577 RepID=A0A2K3L5U3_TRIPR|nr:hypothetical protein L195_g029822 [Trifolium pratense]